MLALARHSASEKHTPQAFRRVGMDSDRVGSKPLRPVVTGETVSGASNG